MNKLVIIGRLGRDPESRDVAETTVCNFSLAVDGGRKDDPPTWFRVAAWGKLGEGCRRYLSKGRQVCVIGPVSVREYDGRNGEKRFSLEVTAREVEFLAGGKDDGAKGSPAQDHDIPF